MAWHGWFFCFCFVLAFVSFLLLFCICLFCFLLFVCCLVFSCSYFERNDWSRLPLSRAAGWSFSPRTDCLGTMVHVTLEWKLTSETHTRRYFPPKKQGRDIIASDPLHNILEKNRPVHLPNCEISTAGRVARWSNSATDQERQQMTGSQSILFSPSFSLVHFVQI